MRRPLFLSIFFTVTLLLSIKSLALGTVYLWTQIDVPGAGDTLARGINDNGEIIGEWNDPPSVSPGITHGFVLRPGAKPQSFNISSQFLGKFSTEAFGMNNNGDIVGSYAVSPYSCHDTHGFLINKKDIDTAGQVGKFQGFGPNGDEIPFGINNKGEMVGYAPGVGCINKWAFRTAAFSSDTVTIDFTGAPFKATFSSAHGINDAGQIVGDYGNIQGIEPDQAFRFNGNSFESINVAASSRTVPSGINGLGQIVGQYNGPVLIRYCSSNNKIFCVVVQLGIADQGFLRDTNDTITTIWVPFQNASNMSGFGVDVRGINKSGQIVGHFFDTNGSLHGFLATPIPKAGLGPISFCLLHPLECRGPFPKNPPTHLPIPPPPPPFLPISPVEGIKPIDCKAFFNICVQIHQITELLLEHPGTNPGVFMRDMTAEAMPSLGDARFPRMEEGFCHRFSPPTNRPPGC